MERGKKQDISNWYLANQEGNKNTKMYEMENLEIILLCSASKAALKAEPPDRVGAGFTRWRRMLCSAPEQLNKMTNQNFHPSLCLMNISGIFAKFAVIGMP